jgi:Cu-Zn family superoxide dismutase
MQRPFSILHGFHIHEFGDCSSPDGSAAGEHFNPRGEPHGGPQDSRRHAGDLGNLEAAADGTASLDHVDTHLAFAGDRNIVGRGVVVHVKMDDSRTQPGGDAGGRLACGAIGIAKP